MTLVAPLMFVAAAAAMVAAGVQARRAPAADSGDPRLWFAAGGLFLLAAATGLVTHLAF